MHLFLFSLKVLTDRGANKGSEKRNLSPGFPRAEYKNKGEGNFLRETNKGRGQVNQFISILWRNGIQNRRRQGNLSACPECRTLSQAVFSFVLVCFFFSALHSLDRLKTLPSSLSKDYIFERVSQKNSC